MSLGRKSRLSIRAVFLVLILIVGGVILLVWLTGEAKVHTVEVPESGVAPIVVPTYEAAEAPDSAASETRIGSFDPPERVPEYEILEEEPADTGEARAVRILVNTPSRSKADFVLISRDLKARYADYDAISAEFTDTEDLLDYNGGALIFNTPKGATYMGFIYGPPNTKGYYVRAAD